MFACSPFAKGEHTRANILTSTGIQCRSVSPCRTGGKPRHPVLTPSCRVPRPAYSRPHLNLSWLAPSWYLPGASACLPPRSASPRPPLTPNYLNLRGATTVPSHNLPFALPAWYVELLQCESALAVRSWPRRPHAMTLHRLVL